MATVNDVLAEKGRDVHVSHPTATIRDALKVMREKNIGAVPIEENGQVVGIFSERDFARHAIDDDCFDMNKLVKDLMVHPVYFVDPDQKVEECMAVMTTKKLRHLPVMKDGNLIGIISIGDVVKHLMQEKQETIDLLEHFLWANLI